MVAHTGRLLTQAERVLSAVGSGSLPEFKHAMEALYRVYQDINAAMETMWNRSAPKDYLKFRSFIFGTGPGKRLNAMFPNGVVYEGVSNEPTFFRGESGAKWVSASASNPHIDANVCRSDSIIPIADNLLESKLPSFGCFVCMR